MTDQVKSETNNINILWERETSINLGVVGVGVESLEQYELLYKFLNYSCHGSIYRCLILHLQNSKLQIKKSRTANMKCTTALQKVMPLRLLSRTFFTCHMILYHQHILIYLGKKERSITILGYTAHNSFLSIRFCESFKRPEEMKIL